MTEELVGLLDSVDERQLLVMEKLLEIRERRLEFALDHHLNTRGERMDFDHYPHIRELYEILAPHIVLQGSVQSFKMLPNSALVHTPFGWKKNGALKVGDIVSLPNGGEARVSHTQLFPQEKLYKFFLDDGRTVESGADHLWKVLRGIRRKKMSKGRKHLQWNVAGEFEVLTTSEIMEAVKDGSQRFTIPVPTVSVEKPAECLPLDPYFVGLMLGDGEIREANIRFTNDDVELLSAVKKHVAKLGLTLERDGDTVTYFFKKRDDSIFEQGPRLLKNLFKAIGLLDTYSHTKFIPDLYKNGSVAQRLAVLQGLLDTDGRACDHGGVTIRLVSEQLIKDIQEVVWSLGGSAKYKRRASYYVENGKKIVARDCFILNISMPEPSQCFRLHCKKSKLSGIHRRKRTLGAKIVKAEYSRLEDSTCIMLDNADHLYITDGYIVTHNSEWAIIDHFATAYTGLSVFFVIPKYDMRTTYVQNRVDRVVETVPEYKKIIGSGFFDSVSIKNFGRGVVKYVGSNVLADFKEFPADMIVVEEVDECNQDNLDYALDRMRASKYQFTRYLGNPKLKGRGINYYYQHSDQREWEIPCKACGTYHQADWFKSVVQDIVDKEGTVVDYVLRDKEWRVGCGRDIRMICPTCGDELDRASTKGRWIPQNPESSVVGYHISMMCSLINSIAGMWDRFQKAMNDPGKMQQFYNSDLGLPFDAMGNKVTETLLDSCIEEGYNFAIESDCAHIKEDHHSGPCSMGVDIGGNFDVKISFVETRGKRRCLYIGKVRSIEDLLELIDRYNVEKCVVDSMPESTLVQDFQELAVGHNCDVWLCRYRGEGKDSRKKYDAINRVISVDRTEAMDRSFAALRRHRSILPENYTSILEGQFTSEMCGPVRQIVEDDKGGAKFEWTKCKDHQRHADTYELLAANLLLESVLDEVIIG